MLFITQKRLSLFLLMATVALIAVCASARQQQKPEQKADTAAKPSRKTVFEEYLKWRRINPEPVMMDSQAALRCAGPTPEEAKRMTDSPHYPKYITVYVNKLGQDAMLHQRNPHFPAGTVIVKEKRTTPEAKTPELMTVMTKQSAGYDAVHGDWEYAVMQANGKIMVQGKLAKCQNCHDQQKSQDYVFKGYIP